MLTVTSYTLFEPWRCQCGAIVKANEPHGKDQGCDYPSPYADTEQSPPLVCTAFSEKDLRIAELAAKCAALDAEARSARFAAVRADERAQEVESRCVAAVAEAQGEARDARANALEEAIAAVLRADYWSPADDSIAANAIRALKEPM